MQEKVDPLKNPNKISKVKIPMGLEEVIRGTKIPGWQEHFEKFLKTETETETENEGSAGNVSEDTRSQTLEHAPSRIFLPLKPLPAGARLTPEQFQVMETLQKGLKEESRLFSEKELAEKMRVEIKAIKSSILHARRKLGVSSRIDLALFDLEDSVNKEKPGNLSLSLIPIPDNVHITRKEKYVIKQLRVWLTKEKKDISERALASRADMEYGTFHFHLAELRQKTGFKSSLQLAFLDVDNEI